MLQSDGFAELFVWYIIYGLISLVSKWNKVEQIVTVVHPVHDIQFAPNIGQSYHLLAIASKDLSIISLKPLMYVCFVSMCQSFYVSLYLLFTV